MSTEAPERHLSGPTAEEHRAAPPPGLAGEDDEYPADTHIIRGID
ncbi:hypothetical protein [Streptomyces camponoticapitis]|nr:hypothetical protein [Streptomyces camponoticapitis]